MLRASIATLGLLLLFGCDKGEDVDVVGLERKVEVLEQQAKESAEGRDAAKSELAAATEKVDAFEKRIAAAEVELRELKERTDVLERPAPVAVPEVELPTAPTAPPATPGRAVKGTRYRVEIGDAFAKGSDTAKVTIVMFSDFQCPFCARVQKTLKELERDYGKDLRFVAKHNPLGFHKEAQGAATAAEAAGKQGKFWEMHDLLYENTKSLSESEFKRWAKKLKLNVSKFQRDRDAAAVLSKIEGDKAQALKLGSRGTPSFFINGRFIAGAQPTSAFKAMIDEEMKKADERIAAGVARSKVYEDIIASGLEKPE